MAQKTSLYDSYKIRYVNISYFYKTTTTTTLKLNEEHKISLIRCVCTSYCCCDIGAWLRRFFFMKTNPWKERDNRVFSIDGIYWYI